ncbi:MAG: ABC transporter ATP-binding protein [Candidatus Wallbacteria bacterium]|nr:ABC transporter ATP-binding protein [Candidatus Wallbacteria bacterium]
MSIILSIDKLGVTYSTHGGCLRALDEVSMDFESGSVSSIIGESGCGKSTMIKAVMGVIPENARISPNSKIIFQEENILKLSAEKQRQFRWRKASMVFQAAQNALNPTLKIEEQLKDSIWDHDPHFKNAGDRILELLSMVRLDPDRVLSAYPHQLSGGMRQRVIIAMSMVLDPEMIILDEPTTALDMITQHYIFDIFQEIQKKKNLTLILITHDIAIAAKLSQNMIVMYGGEVMEISPTEQLFAKPIHPYTRGLIDAIPFIDGDIVKKKPIKGSPPDLINKITGCVFSSRCESSLRICETERPYPEKVTENRFVSCHRKEMFS